MAFQYNGPGVTPKDTVRFLIGDTEAQDPLLMDTEIEYVLSLYNNAPMNAAIRCCEAVISKFARLSNEVVGPVKMEFSQKAEAYRKLLVELRNRLATEDTEWYAGGVIQSESQLYNHNKNIVKPDFRKHMMENQLISPWISGPVNEFPGWWW